MTERPGTPGDDELAAIVRDTFASREPLVAGRGGALPEAVRRRVARRRSRLSTAIAGAAALAVVLAIGVPLALARGDGRPVVAGTPSGGPPATFPPTEPAVPPPTGEPPTGPDPGPGWRIEGSLGMEIAVPADWATNDFGCNMTDRSSFVRGGGSQDLCYTPEPATKEVAILDTTVNPPWPEALAARPVTLGGVTGLRAEGRLPDGRYAGWITLPLLADQLVVRTRAKATTTRILDSLRIVAVDHLGCPSRRPKVVPQAVPGKDLVPPDPAWIAVCYYGSYPGDRIISSDRIEGADARGLAGAVNAAHPGRNPTAPAELCMQTGPPLAGVVLRVRAAGSATTWLWITYEECVDRGLDNGVRLGQVTKSLVELLWALSDAGGGYGSDLPP